jgi:SAM-dependent methyltransferase
MNLETSKTRSILGQYCHGRGIEIGPGDNPYCDHQNTIFVDKFQNGNIDVVSEADNLPFEDDSFDYLLSSHCLEHLPDTLKALHEWKRVVKKDGTIFLILPHCERTFDKGREKTTLKHHIDNYKNRTGYDDRTHWNEFLMYSIPQYPHKWIGEAPKTEDGIPDFRWIVKKGHLHYHVWTLTEMVEILEYLNLGILFSIDEVPERKDSFLVVTSNNGGNET